MMTFINILQKIALWMMTFSFAFLPVTAEIPSPAATGGNGILPITVKIKASAEHIEYRNPVDFYLTFTNPCAEPRELILSQVGKLMDPSMLSFCFVEKTDSYYPMVSCLGNDPPTVVLQPHQSVTMKIPARLLPPGKHVVVAKYNVMMRWPLQKAMIYSNPVEIMVEDRPLSGREAETLRKEYQALGKQFEQAICHIKDKIAANNDVYLIDTMRIFNDKFLVGSPYSVPVLMDLIENSPYPFVRHKAAQTLGIIGSPSKSRWFYRDTMAVDLLSKRIHDEPIGDVRSTIIWMFGFFMDALTPQQREDYRKHLQEQLKMAKGGSQFPAACMLAKHFPQDAELVRSHINDRKSFTDCQQGIILQELDKHK